MTTNDASLNTMEKLRDYAQNYYKENKIGWDSQLEAVLSMQMTGRQATPGLPLEELSKISYPKNNTDYIVDETNDISE